MSEFSNKHCPDCYVGDGDFEMCKDDDCLCHKPLQVQAGDETKATARFGP